ncbi:hypothetical protein [Veillonella rogosae]|uniref:hypothetical protein n=1 Tax=Veillonella rogosae TaxID=423477 RepID=UPI0034E25637
MIYYYIVYQFMVLLLVILIYSIGTILPTILLKNIFLSSIVAIFLIWCFIYLLKVLIQRLHDSYSSAFLVIWGGVHTLCKCICTISNII